MWVSGLKGKWNHRTPKVSYNLPILGITDDETVMLDFDNTSFKWVKYWALRACRWFKLNGFIILKSSKNCYHVVFDRKVSWRKNMHIVAWVCLLSKHRKLTRWFIMQCIKEKGSTLRVSPKSGNPNPKPSPRVVYRYGKQDGQIREFLNYRKMLKNIINKMEMA